MLLFIWEVCKKVLVRLGTRIAQVFLDDGPKSDLNEMNNTELKLSNEQTAPTFDRLVKYVRVRSGEGARFVEFDFAIGDPSLFVELVMPQGAFEHFCRKNEVIHMTTEQMQAVDAEMDKWRYGEDTLMAHNHNRATQ